MIEDLGILIKLYIAGLLSAFIFWPSVNNLFKEQKPFTWFSSILGLIIISFLSFFLSFLFKLPVNLTILFSLVISILFNLFLYKREPFKFNINKTFYIKNILIILLASFIYALTSYDAYIHGIERVMDFGFVKSIQQHNYVPANDVWYTGNPINYYYFGHYFIYAILFLVGLTPESGFFAVNNFIFVSVCIILFEIVYLEKKYLAAISSILFFGIMGPIHSILWLNEYIKFKIGYLTEEPFFWYAQPTRVINGTITEFPLYSFIEATNHAHTMGYLISGCVLYLLQSLWNKYNPRLIYLTSFFVGISFIVNSWDIATTAILSLSIFAIIFLLKPQKEFIQIGFKSFIIFLLTIMPFVAYYKFPVGGVGMTLDSSNYKEWFLLWGNFIYIGLAYIVYRIINFKNRRIHFIDIVFTISVIILTLIELIYIKDALDDSAWYRANTVFKFSAQIWLFMSIFVGIVLENIFNKLNLKITKVLFGIFLSSLIIVGLIYPIKTYLYFKDTRTFTGYQNSLAWFKLEYPIDYEAMEVLKNDANQNKNNQLINIIEAPGESYKDHNLFSAYTGYGTIIGWLGHEMTWRSNHKEINQRAGDVWEFYTGNDKEKASEILKKYNIDYIIIGTAEKNIYNTNLNYSKINNFGTIIFDKNGILIIRI